MLSEHLLEVNTLQLSIDNTNYFFLILFNRLGRWIIYLRKKMQRRNSFRSLPKNWSEFYFILAFSQVLYLLITALLHIYHL